MATELRDFSDFHAFPGTITNGIYTFPPLYNKAKSGKLLTWRIFIALREPEDVVFKHNWDIAAADFVPIPNTAFNVKNAELPYYAAYWTERKNGSDGALSRTPATLIKSGSKGLIGKANERNVFTQALIKARSEFEKKISNGYSLEKNPDMTNALYYAMAAHNYKDHVKKVSFPTWSQPKLDGVRCVATQKNNTIIKYSRDQKAWGYPEFDDALRPHLKPGIHFDGELYLHRKHLQEITGVARNEKKAFELEYHIFDIFDTTNPSWLWSERWTFLNTLKINHPRIKIVPATQVNDQAALDKLYAEYIATHYEGQMIRMDAPYEFSQDRELRSHVLLKRKRKFDAEYELVRGERATNGRAVGIFIGVFKVSDTITFNATWKEKTMDEMREFADAFDANPNAYIGQLFTIEFEDLSKDKVPLRPKIKAMRRD